MFDFNLGYREVILDQSNLDQWKQISLNTGGSQGTLQDIKISERSDGFCYRYQNKYHTRNRFIYWHINHDILELVEHSLDINLAGNRVRYKFVDTPILDGVSINETFDNIIVLVPTVCTVHRLVFPHPDKYHPHDDVSDVHPDLAAPSIFSEANSSDAGDPTTFHFFSNPSVSNNQLPYLAASTLILSDEEAIFILAYQTGELLLVKQFKDGKITSYDLKNETIMPRFLSGLADKLRQKDKDNDTIVSLLLHTWGLETYALTLLRNGQLKFWSCSKGVCVAVIDIIAETGDNSRKQIQGVQNHILKKAIDGDESDCILGIFMSFTSGCQLHIFQPVIVNGQQIRLARLNTLHLSQDDLIDFTLSLTQIWTIWRTANGNCEVYTSSVQSHNEWVPVLLEKIPDSNQPPIGLDHNENDPRQIYLQYIFEPGRFPTHIISKALNIYKKSTIMNLSTMLLKQQICMAVESEIQNELKETIVKDEDYLDCANYCWQRFYSCCVQYHIQGLKPLGLLLLPNSSGGVFLRKSMISFLRPLDVFEHILYNNQCVYKDQITNLLNEDIDKTDDVLILFQVIDYLNEQVSEIFGYTFEKELSMLRSPDIIMSALFQKIQNEMDNEFTGRVVEMLSQCHDLYQAIHKTLELLRIDNQQSILIDNQSDDETLPPTLMHNIFTSNLGIAFVNGCLRQQIQTRFLICRNLLLISNIILDCVKFGRKTIESIKLVCIPKIVVLTQANYVTLWLSNLPVLTNLPTETAMLRLSSLKLNPVFNFRINHANCASLLELFIGSTGGYEARQLFAHIKHTKDSLLYWHLSLLPYLNSIFHIIWPISGGPILAEWLLSCGQHLWLQQFVRLLSTWCEWNSATYDFLSAASLLTTGEHYKALKLFQTAGKGVCTDQWLMQHLTPTIENNDSIKAYITYCLKVINLFELHKSSDCAIGLANAALSVINSDDPLAATLYSIKFKHHLILKNYNEAYDALNSNPDAERKKDNLRDLIKHLLDEKQLNILLDFKYDSMEELFINILFTRARASSDLINNIYYDILYAYQIKRSPACFRLAASVMYEHAFRLNNLNCFEALEKQFKCLLAANNVLQLCQDEFAFIVIPIEQIEEQRIKLPKKLGSDEPQEEFVLKKQITIIDKNQLRNELSLISAKVKLIRFNSNQYCEISTPIELITLLTSSGLFTTALEICQIYQLSNEIIFQNLTKKCITVTKENESLAWKWLIENDIQDLPANTQSARDVVWNLLRKFVHKYEADQQTVIHKIVCSQLLKMHQFIPYWLLSSYKERNPSELFYLFYSFGRLVEATEIASGYIQAALGYGKEYYGFKDALQPTKPPICLPINGFLNLLQQMQHINDNDPEKPLLAEHENFQKLFETYIETVQRVSNEMCNYQASTSTVDM